MPYVLPDTNAIRGRVLAPREDGTWRALIDECAARGWTLILSELVEWELAALLRRHLEKYAARAKDAARALRAFSDVVCTGVDIVSIRTGERSGDEIDAGRSIACHLLPSHEDPRDLGR